MSKPSLPKPLSLKPSLPKDNLQVAVHWGPSEEPTMVTVSIDCSTIEPLPYRGGFKDIRTGRYLIRECLSNTIGNTFVRVL